METIRSKRKSLIGDYEDKTELKKLRLQKRDISFVTYTKKSFPYPSKIDYWMLQGWQHISNSIDAYINDILHQKITNVEISDKALSITQNSDRNTNSIDYRILLQYMNEKDKTFLDKSHEEMAFQEKLQPQELSTLQENNGLIKGVYRSPVLFLNCNDVDCEDNKEYILNNTKRFKEYIQHIDKNVQCWPFYIEWVDKVNGGKHVICCYFFLNRERVIILDSNHLTKYYHNIKSLISHHMGAVYCDFRKIRIEEREEFYPQSCQIVRRKHLDARLQFHGHLMRGKGTCAIWARFMFIIGSLCHNTLFYDALEQLLEFLAENVYLNTNISIKLQLFVATRIEKFIEEDRLILKSESDIESESSDIDNSDFDEPDTDNEMQLPSDSDDKVKSLSYEPRSPSYEPRSPSYEPRSPSYEPRSPSFLDIFESDTEDEMPLLSDSDDKVKSPTY